MEGGCLREVDHLVCETHFFNKQKKLRVGGLRCFPEMCLRLPVVLSLGAHNLSTKQLEDPSTWTRSSSREVRIRAPTFFFGVVYFSRGTLPQKKGKRALLGDLLRVSFGGNPSK